MRREDHGDGFHAAFAVAHDAIDAAVAAQLALADEPCRRSERCSSGTGLHSGPAELRDGDYYGTFSHRTPPPLVPACGVGDDTLDPELARIVDGGFTRKTEALS